jgi:hypothetical protein
LLRPLVNSASCAAAAAAVGKRASSLTRSLRSPSRRHFHQPAVFKVLPLNNKTNTGEQVKGIIITQSDRLSSRTLAGRLVDTEGDAGLFQYLRRQPHFNKIKLIIGSGRVCVRFAVSLDRSR